MARRDYSVRQPERLSNHLGREGRVVRRQSRLGQLAGCHDQDSAVVDIGRLNHLRRLRRLCQLPPDPARHRGSVRRRTVMRLSNATPRRAGVTLIELLIVMLIIAILASLSLSAVFTVRESQMKNFAEALVS